MERTSRSLADYFDNWYTDMAASSAKDEILQRHLGLPPYLLSTSLLTWDALAEVTQALQLSPGDVLLDLACGRGGYGLEVAQRTGAALVGVDLSTEAVRQAVQLAGRLGRAARFRLGDLTSTGLPDGSVSAVLCVDAIQFASSPADSFRELMRVLAPGGRVVLTCWEPVDRDDPVVPQRLRELDLRGGLVRAGFSDIDVSERPGWSAVEQGLWREAASLDPGDDPALLSLRDEGVQSLVHGGALRRVLATATAA